MHSKRNALSWYLKSRWFVYVRTYWLLKQKSFMTYLTQSSQQKEVADKKQKKVTELQKMEQNLSEKF